MARGFTIKILMDLAKSIGANPQKFMGTRTNISFLGKGPTKNPLFQQPLAGIDQASMKQLGPGMIPAVEDAMGFATAGKLNSIQTEILGKNMLGIKNVMKPPVLPSATVTPIAPGIEGLKRFPKESHRFFGRPLKDKDFTEIDELVKRGRLPEPGTAGVTAMLEQKTGMSRAIARQILQQDTRLNLKPEELFSLRTGSRGEDPLDLMRKYYGESMLKYDDFLNSVNLEAAGPAEFAEMVLKHIKLTPQFAEGGLAEVLQAPRSGYSKGRLVKGALAILNRNKKNADYMFKASDNVSPGYAAGDLKYNAELLADQLADDAGVVFADLDSISQTKFYGTAYDYLAKEMGMFRQMKNILLENRRAAKDYTQLETLKGFDVKGRKPSASGGLAKILEV